MKNEASDGADRIVDIDPRGDVIFIVGSSKRRLRVSSFIRRVSPVLEAMLSPNFSEGKQLLETGSVKIPLPEDAEDAMEIVFCVIHGRNDLVPDTLSPDLFLRVAIACDKYDCIVPLSFATRVWWNCNRYGDPKTLWTWAMAACLLRNAETFKEATSWLVLNYAGSYMDLVSKSFGALDPVISLRAASKPFLIFHSPSWTGYHVIMCPS